jgi:hypothetical protein
VGASWEIRGGIMKVDAVINVYMPPFKQLKTYQRFALVGFKIPKGKIVVGVRLSLFSKVKSFESGK